MSRVIQLVDSLITEPVNPPMTVAYAKLHIKALTSAEDTLIAMWILAAAQYFEEQTGRQAITAVREAWMDEFPLDLNFGYPYGPYGLSKHRRIEIPRPPLQDVISVKYINGDGNLVSYSDGGSPDAPFYAVKAPQGPYATRGWIEPISGNLWPIARPEGGAVRIQYRCGYGDDEEDMPPLLTGILCYLVAHFDQFRSAVHEARRGQVLELPYGVQMMLDGFKYSALPGTRPRTSDYGGNLWL